MGNNVKYRLRKPYPHSPIVGVVITSSNGMRHTYEIAKEYPEFWEEVELLGTTEDNVPIYNGDLIYQVINEENILLPYPNMVRLYVKPHINQKFFSDKESAEEYILSNKKAFSMNDILNIYLRLPDNYSEARKELIKLVKSK